MKYVSLMSVYREPLAAVVLETTENPSLHLILLSCSIKYMYIGTLPNTMIMLYVVLFYMHD